MDRWARRSATLSLAGLICVAVAFLWAFLWERPPPAEAPNSVKAAEVTRSEAASEVVVLPPPPLPPQSPVVAAPAVEPTPAPQPAVPEKTVQVEPPPAPEETEVAAPAPAPAAVRPRPQKQPEKQVAAISPAKPPEQPEPQVRPAPSRPAPRETRVDRHAVEEGRVFLRLMAQDKGPDIRIAWPDEGRRRDGLYRLLTACYGLKSAVLREGGRLYVEGGAQGEPWDMNRDFYSSLLRAPEGRLPAREKGILRSIEAYHGVQGQAVRVLPRMVDAGIVGTLMQLAGGAAGRSSRITARYEFDRSGLSLSDIVVAGRRLDASVRVPKLHRGCS